MGDSLPPPADFDLVGSFARRRGTDIEVVLAEPSDELRSTTSLVLRRGTRRVDLPAEVREVAVGTALVARAPARAVADGVWSVQLPAEDVERRISARLLVQGKRPLVLLWGARTPKTVVPTRTPGSAFVIGTPPTPKQTAAATAGRVLDKALARLPQQRARQVRSAARSAARRVLG